MTENSKLLIKNHMIRKTKKQKDSFIEYVERVAGEYGYDTSVERGSFGSRNVVIGHPEKVDVVYTAHYDTCARILFPNFITPKSIFIYILYQIAIVLGIYAVGFVAGVAIGIILNLLGAPEAIASRIIFYTVFLTILGLFLLISCGPANKNTANDNTSGVCTVIDIMAGIPEDKKDKVAFILFDMEELGLVGSSSYFAKHKDFMKTKLLINFDCVGDGKHILFAAKKRCEAYKEKIMTAFSSDDEFTTELCTSKVVNPSDQMAFPLGVGAVALKKTKRGLLYLDRIHTSRDTVCEEENVDFLVSGAIKLIELL